MIAKCRIARLSRATAAAILALLLGLSACGRGEVRFAVTADEILRDYRSNPVAAEAKYLDETGKIAGQVSTVEPRDKGRAILRLAGLGSSSEQVSCMFTGNKALAALAGLRGGQEVTVIGKVIPYNAKYGVRLADCTLDLEIKVKELGEPKTKPEPKQETARVPAYVPPVSSGDQYSSISAVVEAWSQAHNNRDMALFSSLFADQVQFYAKTYSRNRCVEEKHKLLSTKYPDFRQETSDLSLSELPGGQIRADFLKVVYYSGKSNTYQAYLILDNQSGRWQITKESDLTTERNLKLR